MKHILYPILLALALCTMQSCEQLPEIIPVTSISLDSSLIQMTEGDTQTLVATVSPFDASNKTVLWSTDNSAVAKVSDGVVTAVGAGSATITAKTDDGGFTAKCTVQVKAKYIAVSGVELNKDDITFFVGDQFNLRANVLPENATNKNIIWESSNSEIATVDDGTVQALAPGSSVITVTTEDSNKKDSCVVKVIASVASVNLDKTDIVLHKGETTSLKATIKPENATNQNVIWSSTNSNVATVENGLVTAVGAGNADIIVTTEDGGLTATCNITVLVSVTGVALNEQSILLVEGWSQWLDATVSPEDASDKSLVWSTSNSSVATVDNGYVTAVGKGEAVITVKTVDGGFSTSCSVKVSPKATSLKLSRNSFMADLGECYDISVEVFPEDAYCDLQWYLSNSSVIANIIDVSDDGRRATVRMSTTPYTSYAGINVYDCYSGLSESMKIYEVIEDFTWTESDNKTYGSYPLITIATGETHQLKYSCLSYPLENVFGAFENFVFYEPTYVVDYPSCISIDPNGVITGVKPGIVGIKATGRIIKKSGGVDRVYINVVDAFEEEEPNNDFPYATEMREGFPMKFYLNSTSDVDVFKIVNPKDGRTNDRFKIRVDYSGDGGGSSVRVMRWELYNSDYQLFGSGTCNFSGSGGTFQVESWLNTATGYLKFYFDYYPYPETCPSGALTLQILE